MHSIIYDLVICLFFKITKIIFKGPVYVYTYTYVHIYIIEEKLISKKEINKFLINLVTCIKSFPA